MRQRMRLPTHIFRLPLSLLAPLTLLPGAAAAHTQVGLQGGLASGFMHPILGPDHLVAMVAVGLWGAQLRAPAIWLLPITFPALMAVGGLVGILGLPLPLVEAGVSLSAVVLGVLVALAVRLPLAAAVAIVAVFAIFHGYAHGAELPDAVNPLAYGVGFVVSTGLLHLAGILIGLTVHWPVGARVVQACGVAVAITGAWYLLGSSGVVG